MTVRVMSRSIGNDCLPVGENLAVVVHLDLQHLVLVQPAGNGPPERLEESRASDQRRKKLRNIRVGVIPRLRCSSVRHLR